MGLIKNIKYDYTKLVVVERGNTRLFIRPESIIVEVKGQYILFYSWYDRWKKPFTLFTRELRRDPNLNMAKVYSLANRHHISMQGCGRSSIPAEYWPESHTEDRELVG